MSGAWDRVMVPSRIGFVLLCVVVVIKAQDCSQPTPGLNMILSNSQLLQSSFPDQSTAQFECEIGYVPARGSGKVTCQAGHWSDLTLLCERRSCGHPGEKPHLDIEYVDGDALFGDRIKFSCNPGFILVGKDETRCGPNGIWSDWLPTCEAVTCPPPPDILNGRFTDVKEFYTYQEAVLYECASGFTLNGSRSRHCSEDETFHPEPPTCIKVACSPFDIENSEWVGGIPSVLGHRATLTYKCKTGFGNEQTHRVVCGLDSQWSPRPPQCEPNKYVPPPPTTKKVPTTTNKVVPPSPPSPPVTPRVPSTKKVPTTSRPTVPVTPGSGATKWWQSWWFILLALIISAILAGFGVRAFMKKKRGSREGYKENVATKDEEQEL